MPRLAAVIVTYKTRDILRKCLMSLQDEMKKVVKDPHIVVVDNASGDGTAEMVRAEFPDVELIVSSSNEGPAKAFNRGLARSIPGYDVVIVMNSDVIVLPGTLAHMLDFLEQNPEVHGVSCPLLNEDMSPQKTRTHISRLLPKDTSRPFIEDFVGTSFAMLRTTAYTEIGGYDENYYFYNEDLDWAKRSKRAGLVFYHLPDGKVIHILGQGRKHNISNITRELYKSNIYYMKRHHRRLAPIALRLYRIEIWSRMRRLRNEIRSATGADRDRLVSSLQVLADARTAMDREYRIERQPSIPQF